MDLKEFNSLIELMGTLPDEQSCIDYLEKLRWNYNVVSPFDSDSKVYKLANNRYRCKNTGNNFNVRSKTIFSGSRISLRKWFIAMWLVTVNKKGISSCQLARDIKVTQKTAWFMLQRIRLCYECLEEKEKLDGEVELDETFVGDKNKNRHWDKKVKNSQGRSFKDKTPVLGMLQHGGKVICRVVRSTSEKDITTHILQHVHKNAVVYTDEWKGYRTVWQNYCCFVVDHGKGQYVDGIAYTNTIDGFWSILKRGIIGIYHKTSRKHLHKYVNEFTFRYNTRKERDSCKFNLLLCNVKCHITYKKLVA